MRYLNSSHTYSGVQVGSASTGFVPACSTFLIEHLETAGLHRSSVRAGISLKAQRVQFSCPDHSISIVESPLFLANDQMFWVGKTFDRLIERTRSVSVEQSAEDMVGEESESSCALPG